MRKKPGRRTAAELSTPVVIQERRPAPPAELTERQAAIWTNVVGTKPAAWFCRATQPLLANYCRHLQTAADITVLVDTFDRECLKDPDMFKHFDLLSRCRDRETRAALALGRAMRLTQQAQLRAETAARQHDKVPTADRPWEFKT